MDKKSIVQAVVFKTDTKEKWNVDSAKKWLKKNKFERLKPVDKTKNSLRYRILDPTQFKSFSTKVLKDVSEKEVGINLVLGFKSNSTGGSSKQKRKPKKKKKGTIRFRSIRNSPAKGGAVY